MDAMIDLYPSRQAAEPSILPRQDPVLHGAEGADTPGPLSKEQLERYEREGFLYFERLFSPAEIAALEAEMRRMWEEAAHSAAETIVREPDSDIVRSIFAIHRDNALFRRLVAAPRLVRMAEQILGSRVYVHQSRINFKRGFRGKEFYWHSDFETWHIEDGMPRMRALSMSVSLSDNTAENGPLMVIPGSHRHYVTCVGATPDNHYKTSLRKQEYGVPDDDSLAWLVAQGGGIAAPIGPAGSVVLFDCNAMHGSNSNITPFPRSNVFFVYNSVANRLQAPFGARTPRPDFIASRDFAPIG